PGKAPRLPHEERRQVLAGDDARTSAEGCARDGRARRDGGRRHGSGRRLLRNAKREGVRVARRGRELEARRGRIAAGRLREGRDRFRERRSQTRGTYGRPLEAQGRVEMAVRVLIPGPLQPFSDGRRIVALEGSPATVREALEALGARHPGVRDRVV